MFDEQTPAVTIAQKVGTVAEVRGQPMAQVAWAWLPSKPVITDGGRHQAAPPGRLPSPSARFRCPGHFRGSSGFNGKGVVMFTFAGVKF